MARKRTTAPPADVAQSAHETPDPTKEAQDRFLTVYLELASVKAASEAAGVGRRTHYDWLEADPGYAERFAAAKVQAKRIAGDEFFEEARRRALDRSDKLLIEMLRAHMPETFVRRLEHTGKNGAPIAHAVVVRRDLSKLTDAQLEAAEDIARTLEAEAATS